MKNEEQNKIIKENWLKMENREIGELVGISADAVQKRGRRMNLPRKDKAHQSISQKINADKEAERSKNQGGDLLAKYKALIEINNRLERDLEILHTVKTVSTVKISKRENSKSEAVAVVLASDWHVGERVDPETISGVNSYNEVIAQKRGEQFFQNTLRLLQICEKDVEINTMILALLGDFITNTIHEELAETNTMLPADELSFAQNLIISGIEFLLQNTKVKLIIPCHSGNHGRMTKKQRISSEAGNSLEYFMYKNIASHFRNEKRIEFIIPRSYFSFVTVGDKVLRFSHGHHTQYGGGVGGITIPVNKAIAQWNKTRKADYDFFGHFHQFLDGGYWICNGSMMGFNAYAESIKAGFEPPKQAFFLIDFKRGKTITAPILFDD